MNRDVIFGDSVYAINLSRQEKLRMPEQQANAEEISCLSKFIQTKISEISSDFTFIGLHEFVDLRDSLCARLILFNARRGGEPSRLKLRQLEDAWMKRWVDEEAVQKLEVWEQKLFSDLHIAYQPGKGNHLVPVLIPRDLVKPLKILTDPDVRDKGDVHEENVYVFPMTGKTMNHVHGWASINKMCKMATCKNPELLTASKQRHRISTLYCALEVTESDRDYFYKHMGHSKSVNIGTYQYPLPVMEVTKVGKHLQDMDKAACRDSPKKLQNDPMMPEESSESACRVYPKELRNGLITSEKSSSECASSVSDSEVDSMNEGAEPILEGKKGRHFFRWSKKATDGLNKDFDQWISLPSGNKLPSKGELLKYLDTHPLGCSYAQLRIKIMNEQNKRQRRAKSRLLNMNLK